MEDIRRAQAGWIEVITGSMFSGKSEELIRRLRRAQIGRQKVQIFKPGIDDRYGHDHVTSHSDMRIASENVGSSRELLERVDPATQVVGIDEGQFFDLELPMVCNALADQHRRVIVAGLDQDYLGKPFEPMPHAAGDRRVHHQDARRLRRLRRARQPHAAAGAEPRARARRRAERLRGALPSVFRSDARGIGTANPRSGRRATPSTTSAAR